LGSSQQIKAQNSNEIGQSHERNRVGAKNGQRLPVGNFSTIDVYLTFARDDEYLYLNGTVTQL